MRNRKLRLIVEWGVVPIVIAVIVLALIAYNTKADSSPAPTTHRSCVDVNGNPCPGRAIRAAKQFREGLKGNSAGREFSNHAKQLIKDWYAAHPRARRKMERMGNDWWRYPFEAIACTPVVGGGYKANCESAAAGSKVFHHEVTKVVVTCGGAAVIGSLATGGQEGAGKGALACFWAELMTGIFRTN